LSQPTCRGTPPQIDFGLTEWHGHNAFIRDGERVFRMYFGRGPADPGDDPGSGTRFSVPVIAGGALAARNLKLAIGGGGLVLVLAALF